MPPSDTRRHFLRAAGAGLGSGLLGGAWWAAAPRRAIVRAGAPAQAAFPAGRLAVVDAAGITLLDGDGTSRRVAVAPAGGWLQDPVWSPDGTRLAYSRIEWPPPGRTAPGEVPWPASTIQSVQPFEPGAPVATLLAAAGPKEAFVSPAWSPDGQYLYGVRRQPAPGSAYGVLTDVVRLDTSGGGRDALDLDVSPAELSVSPDGTLAVVGAPKGVLLGTVPDALYLVTPSGATRLASTEEGFSFLTLPRFSPDGRRLVFAAAAPAAPVAPGAPPFAFGASSSTDGLSFRATGAQALARLAGGGARTAYAHGVPAAPWMADLDAGTLRPLPAGPFDDVVGLAWAAGGDFLLLLDATGLVQVAILGGTQRLAPVQASGLAWRDA